MMEAEPRRWRRWLGRTWSSIDNVVWRTGAWLRLRNDPLAALVPAEFRHDGMYVSGRNGRMFLAHDSSRVLDQHSGRLDVTAPQLEAWHDLLERRAAALAANDCTYVMLIVPNAHSAYPEDLPKRVSTVPRRPVDRMLSFLGERGSQARVVYPLQELLAHKREREVFPRTETHWNEFGAFAAYQALAAALGPHCPMRRITADEVWFFELSGPGDLGIKRRLPRKSPHLFGYPRHPTARMVDDNAVEGTGSVIATESKVLPCGTCVVFGDSYAFGLLPYLCESFHRVVFAQTPAVDHGLVERERPAVVVTVISERFLVNVPNDEAEPTVEELALAKVAEGRVRPRLDRWDAPRPVSPAEVEWIRARMVAEGRLSDAIMVCAMAYAGLLPAELHTLRWRHVEPGVLLVPARGGARRGPARQVHLLAPLARDLAHWRTVTDAPGDRDLVFPAPAGGWGHGAWPQWIEERYAPLAGALGLEGGPGTLRTTFASLSIHAGAAAATLAAELGIDPDEATAAFSRRIADAEREGHVSAEAEIERGRVLAATCAARQPAAAADQLP